MDNDININGEIKDIERQIRNLSTRLTNLKNKEKTGKAVRIVFQEIENPPIQYICKDEAGGFYYDYASSTSGDVGRCIVGLAKELMQDRFISKRKDGFVFCDRSCKKIRLNELSDFQYEIVKSLCNDISKIYNNYFKKYHSLNDMPIISVPNFYTLSNSRGEAYSKEEEFKREALEKLKPDLEKKRIERFKELYE